MAYKLPKVNTKYGALMGRASDIGAPADREDPRKFYLNRINLDSGGYDNGGAYWGHDIPLYVARSVDGEIVHYMRASNRNAAKAQIVELFPLARFFR